MHSCRNARRERTRFARWTWLTLVVIVIALTSSPARAERPRGVVQAPRPAWVDPIAGDDAGGPGDGGSSGERYVLFDHQVRVGRGPTDPDERYEHWSKQIVDESGLQSDSQVQIAFDPTYQDLLVHTLTIRREGKTLDRLDLASARVLQREPNLDSQVYDGRETAVLFVSDLRVGDVVDYEYSLRGSDPTLDGKVAEIVSLGTPFPIGRMRARVVAPRGRSLAIRIDGPPGKPLAPAKTESGDEVTYAWDLAGPPVSRIEATAPGWYSPIAFAAISEFASWGEVAAWGEHLFHTAPAGPALRAWVRSRRETAASADSFLLGAIRFVQDEVRYVAVEDGMARRRPSDPNLVFARRYGDCKEKSALLASILTEAGFHARPALVSSHFGHTLDDWPPSPQAFDHAIVKIVKADRTIYWVDPTAAMQGGGLSVFETSVFERALELGPRVEALETMAPLPPSASGLRVFEKLVLLKAGDSGGTGMETEHTYEGFVADMTRLVLRTWTQEQTGDHYRHLYENVFPGIRLAGPVRQEDDRESDVIRVTAPFVIPKFWSGTAAEGFRGDLHAESLDSFLYRPEPGRRSPLAIEFPFHVEEKVEVSLPFDLPSTPSTNHLEAAAWDLRFSSRYGSRTLTYSYTLDRKSRFVEVADLPGYADAIDSARAMLTRSLTYKEPPPDSIHWAEVALLAAAVPFVGWAGWRASRYEPATSARLGSGPDVDPPAVRIGGWLVPVATGLALLPIAVGWTMTSGIKAIASTVTWHALTDPDLATYNPGLAATLPGEVFCQLSLIAYAVIVNVLFWQRKRRLRFHYQALLFSLLAFHVGDHIVVHYVVATSTAAEKGAEAIVRAMITCAIWVPYMRLSRRVRRTFIYA